MKKLLVSTLIAFSTGSCGNTASDNGSSAKMSSATDTITNVTNPGVGSVADDTSKRP